MARKESKQERGTRQREAQQAAELRRRQEQRQRLLRRVGGGILAVLLVIGAFVYYSVRGGTGSTAAASSVLGPDTGNRPASPTGSFQRVSAPLRQGQKPLLLFIGAQYCPFCGAERWAVVKALDRFGTWSNLRVGHSTSGEAGYAGVPTFDLLHAHYTSAYVAFDGKDVADNAGNTLQHLTPQEQTLFNHYDTAGSIPLVYVDGYAMNGSDYSPAELQGKPFATVQHALQTGARAAYVSDINGEANLLTAFLCRAGGNRPASVCGSTAIRAIARGIH